MYKVIIAGKLPPPCYGPAIALNIILNSSLKTHFELIHLDTKTSLTTADFQKKSLRKIILLLSIYRNLYRLIKAHQPDMILVPISQSPVGFLKDSILILISKLLGVKVLLQLRGSDFKNMLQKTNFIVRSYIEFILRKGEGIIVLGKCLKHLFKDYFPDNQIYVAPNGGDYSFPQIEKRQNNILYLANFRPTKGLMEVLKGVKILKDKKIDYSLTVGGTWQTESFKKECISYINKNKLPVTICEGVYDEEKWKVLAEASIFVFTPNAPEGHPWVIVEALAAGLPIISTDQGAIKESVIHGKNGFIVPVNNPPAIARHLESILQDKNLRSQLSKESITHYTNHFTEEKMVKNYVRIFNDICSRN
jgi:glycosyltransferase involved in cell wall biosynthesis